ncbi:MAG TPA: SGNH/GDSL hydrolase family protein [Planctomycetota bacterium]|nr:SGNH/GDSL hydrolase family protein [Planctomycetota bacterium]
MTSSTPNPRRRRPRRLLSLLAALALVTLLATEVGFRIADWRAGRDASFFLPRDFSSGMFMPHPSLGFMLRPGYDAAVGNQVHINALGMRGPEVDRVKAPGVFRIVCLGGSTTFGRSASGDAATYPGQLQRLLDEAVTDGRVVEGRTFEVLNAGVGNWNSADSLINLELRLLDLQPDAILDYEAVNDLLLTQSSDFVSDYSNIRRSPPIVKVTPFEHFLLSHVRTYAHLARGTDPEEQFGTLSAWVFVDDFRDRLVPSSQWINEAGLATLARNLTNIVAVARAHDIVPVLSTFAVRNSEGETSDDLGPAMKAANDTLRALAVQLDVPIVPAAERLQDQPELYKDWMHFTDRGERRHAEVVMACLVQQQLFGLSTRPTAQKR